MASFHVCAQKNKNIVQIYGALSTYIQSYKRALLHLAVGSGVSGGGGVGGREGCLIIGCTKRDVRNTSSFE